MVGAGWRTRRRVVVIGVGIVAVLGVVVVFGTMTHWFGLGGDSQRDAARIACLDAVRRELAAPSTAHFDKIRVREDSPSEDDHVRLGFDVGKVTAVRVVTGVVTSAGRSGQDASLEFACRAFFFADQPNRSSVSYGSADLPGQLKGRT